MRFEGVGTPSREQQQAISLGKIILTKWQTSLMEKRKSSTIIYTFLLSFFFLWKEYEREREKSHKSVEQFKKKKEVRSDFYV